MNVLQYKKLFHWGYITGYPIVTIFLGVFFYNYHQWWMVLTISILMLMAILTDYFLFHYVSDRIKELTRVNKELAELKEEHKEYFSLHYESTSPDILFICTLN